MNRRRFHLLAAPSRAPSKSKKWVRVRYWRIASHGGRDETRFCRWWVAAFLYRMLIRLARERGITQFVADVLFANTAMMKVFRNVARPVKAILESGVYHLTIALEE